MGTATWQRWSRVECPHCGGDSGFYIAMRCLRCERVLCSRQVTPVLATSPYYPHKHRDNGHDRGPVQPLLLPAGDL